MVPLSLREWKPCPAHVAAKACGVSVVYKDIDAEPPNDSVGATDPVSARPRSPLPLLTTCSLDTSKALGE